MTLPADETWARAATPGAWTERAACRGQGDLFFIPTGRHELKADKKRADTTGTVTVPLRLLHREIVA